MGLDALGSPSFFVFGPQRAGTTLLAFMLSGQPGTLCLNDTFVYARLADAAEGETLVTKTRRLAGDISVSTVRAVTESGLRAGYQEARTRALQRRFRLSAPVPAEIIDGFLIRLARQYQRHNDWYDFLARYAEPLARAAEDLRSASLDSRQLVDPILSEIAATVRPGETPSKLGEKTPYHTVLSPWILDLYPTARAVLLVRDPITNVASISKRHRPIKRALALYGRFVPAMLWLATHPRVLAVSYGSLLTRPADGMEAIADFLALPGFDPSVPLRPFGKEGYTGTEVDPSRDPHPDSVLDDVTRARIRRRHGDVYDLLAQLD